VKGQNGKHLVMTGIVEAAGPKIELPRRMHNKTRSGKKEKEEKG